MGRTPNDPEGNSYARKKLSDLLGIPGFDCANALRRGLEATAEIFHGDPKNARQQLTEWTREELEDIAMCLAAIVDESKSHGKLLAPVVQLMANPTRRCVHCDRWFSGPVQRKYCSLWCVKTVKAQKALARKAAA